MAEKWNDIPGYEGLYQVSETGKVLSCRPGFPNRSKLLKQSQDRDGYLVVSLYKDGSGKSYRVHRLVASAFIPNCMNRDQINHIDENKKNNAVWNLEWVTSKENNNHASRNSRISLSKRNKKCKPITQMTVDGVPIKVWESVNEVERNLHFDTAALSRCCRGIQNTSYGYRWAYVE